MSKKFNFDRQLSLPPFIPTVIEQKAGGYRSYDIYSRLLEDRIIFLGSGIKTGLANSIVAQLLFLEQTDPKADIRLYINSPGGSAFDGLAIYDTMNYIKPDVVTICVGQASSMAAVLLAAGAFGKRLILPQARVMIHQPSSEVDGQVTDIEIATRELKDTKDRFNKILAEKTGQTLARIAQDVERDYYLSPKAAVKYGLVDAVLSGRNKTGPTPTG